MPFDRANRVFLRSIFRPGPVAFRQPADANRDDGVPALLRHRVPGQARGARDRAGGRHGVVDGGAASAGGVPAGGAHQAH